MINIKNIHGTRIDFCLRPENTYFFVKKHGAFFLQFSFFVPSIFTFTFGMVGFLFLSAANFYNHFFFLKKFFQEYHRGDNQFVYRSGPT